MTSAMASDRRPASPGSRNQPSYDQEVDDFMRDLDFDNQPANASTTAQKPAKDIDEEVQVKKKRKPNPKLDEARLLSHNGIPKLRRLTKSKLKFRGKGHEYGDITALLNMYQLWLDDLYPKAKFKDGLVMVEKLGHSKRMQITRRAWLDATKPHRRDESPERLEDLQMRGELGERHGETGEAGRMSEDEQEEIFGDLAQSRGAAQENGNSGHESAPEEDELDALLNEESNGGAAQPKTKPAQARGPFEDDSDPDEDELDALMNEEGTSNKQNAAPAQRSAPAKPAPSRQNDGLDFGDDEEAMMSMGW